MRAWPAPSLTRRVLLALLLAFAAVFVALLAKSYLDYKRPGSHEAELQPLAQALAQSLEGLDDAQATLVVQANERQWRALRQHSFRAHATAYPGDLLYVLQRPDGRIVHASPALPAPAAALASRTPPAEAPVLVQGRAHWRAHQATPAWRLTLLEPVVDDRAMLRIYGGALVLPLLIAFPIVGLPLWLAVRRGLAPLRDLASRVAARRSDDFSPLGMRLPYRELKPLEQAFDESFRRSRLGIERERAIVQDAAHELRTPLAVIGTQAHHLALAGSPAERQAARQALDHAIQRSAHLVHQLLTLARLEGGVTAPPAPVDLAEATRQVVIAAAPRAQARGIGVQLESPDTVMATLSLPAFHSVLENLLGNALAYGRPEGQVRISLQADATHCRLNVADDGPGIAEHDRPLLFERFYRGRHVEAPGTGLGLAIVQQAVRQLGGQIRLGPGLAGAGVGFDVVFPARPAAASVGSG